MRAQRMSVMVCFLALVAVLGRGAQIVFEHAASQAKSQMTLVAAEQALANESPAASSTTSSRSHRVDTQAQVEPVIGQPVVPLIIVHLDSYGLPLEVSTNTGRPPEATQAIIATQGGRKAVVSDPLSALIHEHTYVGDWSVPGVWHPWVGTA